MLKKRRVLGEVRDVGMYVEVDNALGTRLIEQHDAAFATEKKAVKPASKQGKVVPIK